MSFLIGMCEFVWRMLVSWFFWFGLRCVMMSIVNLGFFGSVVVIVCNVFRLFVDFFSIIICNSFEGIDVMFVFLFCCKMLV